MKFKLGLLHADLSIRFGLELCYVSKIYSKWVKALSRAMKFLIIGLTDKPWGRICQDVLRITRTVYVLRKNVFACLFSVHIQ